MHESRLPQEVVDNILDILHDDDGSLENSALVARSWVRSCRRHIFNHITIDLALEHNKAPISPGRLISAQETDQNDERMDAIDLLLQVLSTASYLPSYIRRLTLKTSENPPFDDGSPFQADMVEKLAHTLAQLTSLRSVLLVPLQWKQQPQAIQRICLACINRPTVANVALGANSVGSDEILSVLSKFTSTTAMEFTGSILLQRPFEDTITLCQTTQPAAAAMRTLCLFSSRALRFVAMWLSSVPASCRRLETLVVDCFVISVLHQDLQKLLNACPALTTLAVTAPQYVPKWLRTSRSFPPSRTVSKYVLNLAATPHLREVRLACIPLTHETDYRDWLRSIFDTTPTPLPLRHLVLEFEYYASASLETLQPLDDFFSEPHFPCLERLTIHLSTQGPQSEEIGKTAQLLRAQFPMLVERNVIKVICMPKPRHTAWAL